VTGASAVGRPDARAGEVPVVYVTTRAGSRSTARELQHWAAENTREPAAAPREVIILDALPLTDLGKPYKPALRQDAARREAEAALRDAGLANAQVESTSVEGTIVVTVSGTQHTARVGRALDPYTFTWQVRA